MSMEGFFGDFFFSFSFSVFLNKVSRIRFEVFIIFMQQTSFLFLQSTEEFN